MLMSFADPQSITISGTTIALPRTSVEENASEYTSSDGLTKLSASHNYGKRIRRVLRIDSTKLAPDAFRPAENVEVSMSNYIVFDLPVGGFSLTEAQAVYTGFKTLFTGTSDAPIVKLLGGES
jgi:hypothetical protein